MIEHRLRPGIYARGTGSIERVWLVDETGQAWDIENGWPSVVDSYDYADVTAEGVDEWLVHPSVEDIQRDVVTWLFESERLGLSPEQPNNRIRKLYLGSGFAWIRPDILDHNSDANYAELNKTVNLRADGRHLHTVEDGGSNPSAPNDNAAESDKKTTKR